LITWLLIPENAALLNWIGFLVGGLGLAIALFGLRLALKQLKAIKTETEASKAAIESVQLKVASFDTAQECQVARGMISAIRSSLAADDWTEVIKNYEDLIQSFLKLSHSNSPICIEDRALLIKMTKDMANICDGIRKKQRDTTKSVSLRGQDQALRDFADIMTKITFLVVKDLQQ
jgi:hypothetical protein